MEGKLSEKERFCSQVQSEYAALLEKSKKDDNLLVKKQIMLYQIARENNQLKQAVSRLAAPPAEDPLLQDPSLLADQPLNEEL